MCVGTKIHVHGFLLGNREKPTTGSGSYEDEAPPRAGAGSHQARWTVVGIRRV
ncbi:hypothetical protein AWT69_002506 [Pseudomonas putida]|nr:hypothetical protein AWT69_002506 [Pseudomonas putida]